MWPFRQKTVRVEMKMDIALTADGRPPSDYRECCVCRHLVNKAFIKVVRHEYEHPYIEYTEERFCPNCAPEWDLTVQIFWGDYRTRYYRRIPAVPETFEEVNLPEPPAPAPKPTAEDTDKIMVEIVAKAEEAHAAAFEAGIVRAAAEDRERERERAAKAKKAQLKGKKPTK